MSGGVRLHVREVAFLALFCRDLPGIDTEISNNWSLRRLWSCPEFGGKEKWRILPVGAVNDQRAAWQGGYWTRHSHAQGRPGGMADALARRPRRNLRLP